ncbi:hypothetical protein [Poriferisphaera sp. WC338]|uniref:hypothetical protein n=1 Tax=Poriferisphaera sp. WC338 TaxID=3425129 RepID=UPI003D8163A4
MPQEHHATDEELLQSAPPITPELIDEEEDELAPIDVDDAPQDPDAPVEGNIVGSNKIRTFQQGQEHTDHWQRETNQTGTGATHCKTFFCKLRADAIHHLDDQVNEWLDKHPAYEVKFSNVTTGKLVGKITEEAIFMTVWV